ncbi:CDP-glycerol glycerophosphotransferase family protein [Sporolactobacillus shoreicorticis]|uniref:CDP-glycerol glycerophosphotransferase family protein n=1 Tax=Sporolactobacillus shoreicorticis TaxID=1923877 RepID=A0ABW5RY22_9BACL|nr:CDP-glycerol glycerophosphotransferase family protein [Sporolactobacillus shoreicorticis]MCO7125018.1 CDP-glycerol glycerophosphotransferase family protein [Sporolactobacillus shoreicorticis]
MSVFLSLCMIVKNEEKVLKRCLDSVQGGVDEIVIVDTGSTDETKKIAKEYTDSVFDYQWTNSFSEARNFAQSKAKGEWILALDADEYVYLENLKETVKKLKRNDNQYDGYSAKIYNFVGIHGEYTTQHHHTRLYRNVPTIKYKRTIHEQLYKENNLLPIASSDLVIYHSGYMSDTIGEKGKRKRNEQLIDEQIDKVGLNGFDYFNLGNESSSKGDNDQALTYYKLAYQNKPDFDYAWIPACLVQLVRTLINLKRFSDALAVIREASQIFIKSPDFKVLKTNVFILQGRLIEAKSELMDLLDNKEKYQEIITSPDYLDYYPNKWLAIISERLNDKNKAVFYYSQALNVNFNDEDLIKRFFTLLIDNEEMKDVVHFIKKEKWLKKKVYSEKIIHALIHLQPAQEIINQLARLDEYKDNIGIQIKRLWNENRTTQAFEQLNSLSFEKLLKVINQDFFDFTDFLLLCFDLGKKQMLESLSKISPQSSEVIQFLLENGSNNTIKIKDEIYIVLLKRSISLRKFDLLEKLLQFRTVFESTIDIKIGHLLYENHFFDLAIQFYQKAGNENFDEQTYLNLIDECKKNNLQEATYNFCNQAIQQGYYNFSILQNLGKVVYKMNADKLAITIQNLALECYPDSQYLINKTIWGEKRKKIALVYTPLSGSNVTALMRQVPDEITLKYQINWIEQRSDLNYFNELLENDVVVTTEGNYPFEKKKVETNQKVVELWHGFPLKSMGLLDASEVGKEQIKNRWKNIDAMISYSQLYNQSMEKCFGISNNKFQVLGTPRNDMLLQTNGKEKLRKLFNLTDQGDHVIFYMPTWRHTPRLNRKDGNKQWNSLFDMSGFDSQVFERFLAENHYKLIVKLHPADERMFKNSVHESENIFLLTTDLLVEQQLDVYDLLNGADMLITDYSSVYFDYLLLNRPIIFTPVDLEDYRKSRGFVLEPYENWTPGPKVTQQEELQHEILKSTNDQSYYQEERIKIKNHVHFYQDNHSTERVWSFIDQMLQRYGE